ATLAVAGSGTTLREKLEIEPVPPAASAPPLPMPTNLIGAAPPVCAADGRFTLPTPMPLTENEAAQVGEFVFSVTSSVAGLVAVPSLTWPAVPGPAKNRFGVEAVAAPRCRIHA